MAISRFLVGEEDEEMPVPTGRIEKEDENFYNYRIVIFTPRKKYVKNNIENDDKIYYTLTACQNIIIIIIIIIACVCYC